MIRNAGGRIEYSEKDGKLWYKHLDSSYDVVISEGEIPSEIVKKGESAIQKYVEEAVTAFEARSKRFREFGNNLNMPVSVRHRGIPLKGKIVYADSKYIGVRLEKPKKYAGESGMNFGWASAVAGHYVFQSGDEPKLSRSAIEGAQTVLTWIYDEKKNKEDNKSVIDLALKLNERK